MASQTYQEKLDMENIDRLREMIAPLPPYVRTFFIGIDSRTATRTQVSYAYDLTLFFQYLKKEVVQFRDIEIKDITLKQLEELEPADIELYLDYLKKYTNETLDATRLNRECGLRRKLASLRSFYRYFYRTQKIKFNPTDFVETPKIHDKDIIRLDVDEVAEMLDQVESGEKLTQKQQSYHKKTQIRDLALITLLLGTGLRVSECVGLNLNDLDFKNGGLHIHRKGGKDVMIYFGEEVEEALLNYLDERNLIEAEAGSEEAVFLSLQRKRISVRAVEKLVKKYSQTVTTVKKITPHKLRSTYGTALYRETGDIYLVADVLGHTDVNTTRKYYAAMEEEHRRKAQHAITLREKMSDLEINPTNPSQKESTS
ncbi:MAG: tyrosine-type recombinase/integrase [Lachnospiraceae bacterium]